MGQALSAQKSMAEKHAAQGWPAFLGVQDLQVQMRKFRIQKSVMGRRVRVFDRVNGCIEYNRVSFPGWVPAQQRQGASHFYQRVDAPCNTKASIPKFPHALAANEIRGRGYLQMFRVAISRPAYAELVEAESRNCATYRRTNQGIWVKVSEQCKETKHALQVMKQRNKLDGKGESWVNKVTGRGVPSI